MILENDELTEQDKVTIRSNLQRLKKGVLDKVPPLYDLNTGLRNIFFQFDKDGTGVITINELNAMCLSVGVPLERK